MDSTLLEQDLLIHIFGTLPKAYKATINLAENDLMEGSLTIKGFKELQQTKVKKMKGTEGDDIALITKHFKCSCKVCGKIGHKADNRFSLEKNKHEKEEFMKKIKGGQNNWKKLIQCNGCKQCQHYKHEF